MVEALRRFAGIFVEEPIFRVLNDVELAVRVFREAVASGFVVRAGAEDGAVVLSDVEIDRPRAERFRHLGVSGVERFDVGPIEIVRNEAVFRSVRAEEEEERVRHIRLETEDLRQVDLFENFDATSPAVHPAPTDFAFHREHFVVFHRDFASGFKRFDELRLVRFRVARPIVDGARGVDANAAVRADSGVAEFAPDRASLFDGSEERGAFFFGADRGTAPNVGDERADFELIIGAILGEFFDFRVRLR